MAIGDVVELVAALLLSLAVWALSAAEYLLSALQNAVFGNQQLDQPGGDRHQLLEWVRTQLPDQPVHDFGAGWRDGVALRRLVDRLVTGHPSVTGRPEVTADRPVLNVNEAFRRARDVLHQPPTLTVTDVISGCDEDRLAAYVAALREAAERRGEPEHPPETPADMAEPPAAAAGTGLTAAHTGQPAQFAVRLPQAARLDLLVEMRSETGDYFSQRLTPRSPARRSLEDEAPAPVSSSGRPRSNIPVGYQVTGRTVNLWYQPPAAGWLSLSIVSGGQHVEGSPFRVYVGENEEEEGTVDDSDKKSEKDEVKEEVAKEVEKLVDAGLESVTEPIKELSEKPVKDSVIEDGKEHSERVADEPAGEGNKGNCSRNGQTARARLSSRGSGRGSEGESVRSGCEGGGGRSD
ncbi:filamin-A-like isoform X2 [Amphibalanus amphitrite]|uniref:filamin-A-like isoform X2 n=1 Tax=Amphibalanus amphitrite TaxID=1232801 RepID=UPI001C906CE2|nr:filamin-A-like isoform X2 [Amphibalanus amphitrite]